MPQNGPSVFPTRQDITIKVNPAFPINESGSWLCVGIGWRGAILQAAEDETVLRWLAQVLKFSPQDEYIAPETWERKLRRSGAAGANWKAR